MTTDRTLGRPAPNEDKDQNVEQLKTRRKGTIGSRTDGTRTERDRREAERRGSETNARRPAPGA